MANEPKRIWSEMNGLNFACAALGHGLVYYLLIWRPSAYSFPNKDAAINLTWLTSVLLIALIDVGTKHRAALTFLATSLVGGLSCTLIVFADAYHQEARYGRPAVSPSLNALVFLYAGALVLLSCYLVYFCNWIVRRLKQAHSNKQVRGEAK